MGTTSSYEILGLDSNASDEQIKRAYHAMAKHSHPDASNPSHNRKPSDFATIQRAYDILRNPKRRAKHDRSLGIVRTFGVSGRERGGLGPEFSKRGSTLQHRLTAGRFESFIDTVGGLIRPYLPVNRASMKGSAPHSESARGASWSSTRPSPDYSTAPSGNHYHTEDTLPIGEGELFSIRTPVRSATLEKALQKLVLGPNGLPFYEDGYVVELHFCGARPPCLVVNFALTPGSTAPFSDARVDGAQSEEVGVFLARVGSGPFFDEIQRKGVRLSSLR